MVERLDPKRVLNCIENDLSEGPRAPRGRHRKRQGEENSTEPGNRSFFKSNRLEDLKPLKRIVDKEPIHFDLPSSNKKLCDDIPFVDVSFTVNDGFLAKNGLQRLKTVERLIAEGVPFAAEFRDRKLLRAYPYVFVGQHKPCARPSPVKKKVSFSNMDVEINEYTVARRRACTPSVNSKSALKKTSPHPTPEHTVPRSTPTTPDSSRLSRCRIEKLTWSSETKTTSPTNATDRPKIRLKLTSRKIMVDVSPERRGSVSSNSSNESETRERRRRSNGRIADASPSPTPRKQTRSKTRSEEVISIESSDDEAAQPPPPRTPVRTKAALKMTVEVTASDKEKTPEASSSDESAAKVEPTRRRMGRPPKRRRGRKPKVAEEVPKAKAVRARQQKKKRKSMPFKVRFTKTPACSECDMCSSVFTKNVELQLHLLNHLQRQNFVVKVPLIPERVIDKFLIVDKPEKEQVVEAVAEPVMSEEKTVQEEKAPIEDLVSDIGAICDTVEEPVTTSDAAVVTVETPASEPVSSEAEAACIEVEAKPEATEVAEPAKEASFEETGDAEEVSSSDQIADPCTEEQTSKDETCEVNSSCTDQPTLEVQTSVEEPHQIEEPTSCNGVESTEQTDVANEKDAPNNAKRKRSVSENDDELPNAKRDRTDDDELLNAKRDDEPIPGTSGSAD